MRAPALRVVLLFALLTVALVPVAEARPASRQDGQGLTTAQLIAAARQRGEIAADTAHLYLAYALVASSKLPDRFRSQVPWHGTIPLLRLEAATAAMPAGPTRAEIEALLAEMCDDSNAALPGTYTTPSFYVQYGAIGGGLTLEAYTTALDAAWATEVVSFGWAAPPVLPENPPPGDRYHVRIDALEYGLYGYVSTRGTHAGLVGDNPSTAWDDVDAYATCMVLNSDYSPFPGTPLQALQATVAHEFNHSIQFGYGAITNLFPSDLNAPDLSFSEAGSTWMEDEVFDTANDNYNYLWPDFSMCMGEYDPVFPHSVYDYWITFRGLTEPYGTGLAGGGEQVLQDFWEATSQSSYSNMLPALNDALLAKGTTLADAYHAYAIAVKFNKTCGGGYAAPTCFEEGAAYLTAAGPTAVHGLISGPSGSFSGSLADNYSLSWVGLPAGTVAYRLTLSNLSGGGRLRGSVVCDTGTALVLTPFPQVLAGGGSTLLESYDPSGCNSVVAVLTNEAQTDDNPYTCTARTYRLQATPAIDADHSLFLPLVVRTGVDAISRGLDAGSDGGERLSRPQARTGLRALAH